jgi:DNA-binding response OmpR family regulator
MPVSTILVAEDDAPIRDLIRTQLEAAGYDVIVARTGSEAIARALNVPVQGVVLDINMPEVDGFGVLKVLQETPSLRRTPVLMLTARHTASDVRQALALGARDYLTKPFSEQQLVARVARLLRKPFAPPTYV